MPELIDHYFLVDRRDAAFINQFLDHYLPERAPASDDDTDMPSVLSFYEQHPHEEKIVYLRNTAESAPITHAILGYTNDAKLVLGVSVIRGLTEHNKLHSAISSFLQTTLSYMTVEEPPPSNSIEFNKKYKRFSRSC